MSGWNEITSVADINYLLDQYGGFHDSCLNAMFYHSGSYVDRRFMYSAPSEEHELHMIFHSQWYEQPLELCFNGVRKCQLIGFESSYFVEILDCYLAYHNDLIAGRDDPLIVWANYDGFSPASYFYDRLLHEPDITYVVAEKLKWRFITDAQET